MSDEQQTILHDFCTLVAHDLRSLADLHASELSVEQLQALQQADFPNNLALQIAQPDYRLAAQNIAMLFRLYQQDWPQAQVDELASDFASIYLNGSLHASPYESVWLDEEELTCQQAMFEVRECYQQHGLNVPNWRRMADDHLVNELLFIAYLMEQSTQQETTKVLLNETADFMDEHVLRWTPRFCHRVAQRCTTSFYASVAIITSLYLKQIRELLVEILAKPCPTAEEIEARMATRQLNATQPQAMQYYPGMKPSW